MSVASPRRALRALLALCVVAVVGSGSASGCAPTADRPEPASAPGGEPKVAPVPDSAYYLDESLPPWIDPATGYDTTRDWSLEDERWPIALIMSPSQSPQLLVGEELNRIYSVELKKVGITPAIEKIEIPARTFHALQRSKWAFAYMPYAVFTDYCRTNDNQGGAGGLQYVALAGSTAGGGYTLVTKDPAITSVADLAGKTVAGLENNPARIVLMQAAARKAGLELGDAPGDINFSTGPSEDDLNGYIEGRYDAAVVLSIVRDRFLRTGSRALTDFTDVGYTPSYTILVVERSVLEKRPDVVDAFLEAHYRSGQAVGELEPGELDRILMESWNGYFRSQDTSAASQRIASDVEGFRGLLGGMWPEDRVDPNLLLDCFAYLDENDAWGWDGAVDARRLIDLSRYDAVLDRHGEPPQ